MTPTSAVNASSANYIDLTIGQGSKKSGHLWKYHGVTENPKGGKLYHFVLDPKFNHFAKYIPGTNEEMDLSAANGIRGNVHRALKEMYPAVEHEWISLLVLNPHITSNQYQAMIDEAAKILPLATYHRFESYEEFHRYSAPAFRDLNQLGYNFEYNPDRSKVILTFPNRKALQSNWKELKKKYPSLRDLEILSSDGIASDREYIRAFLEGKFVLSKNAEFVHDHSVHLRLILMEILLDQHYPNRNELTTYEKLEIVKDEVKRVFDILERATESLPPDQKSKFDPIYFVLSLNLDVILGNNTNIYAYQLPIFPPKIGLELLRQKFGQDFSEENFDDLFLEARQLSFIAQKEKSTTSHDEQNPKRVKYADSTLPFIVEYKAK